MTAELDTAVRDLFTHHGAVAGSTADAVHDAIAEGILTLALPPGWRLGEERLASLFSVSRTPVREALMRLESESLVTRNRRSGLVVAGITREQIIELYVVREALDGIAARLAARVRTPADLIAMERFNSAVAAAADPLDKPRLMTANVGFHHALASASRNDLLLRFVDQVHQRVRRFRSSTLQEPGRALVAVEEHRAIIEAIRAHDEVAAEEAAIHHMREVFEARMVMRADDGPDGGLA